MAPPHRHRKPWLSHARRRRIAEHAALVVIALQVSLLLALLLVPGDPPTVRLRWLDLLWAAGREPMFYPFVAVWTAGPALTFIALRRPGPHRLWLLTAWAAFVLVLILAFGRRVAVMMDVLWWQVGG